MTIGLFIGRFQPLHIGHISVIENALKEVDSLIIGIGSAEKHHTTENPFTSEERKAMIESSIIGKYVVYPIPDISDYGHWVAYVREIVGKFDVVYSGNAVVNELFQKDGYETKPIVEHFCMSSSSIRDMMVRKNPDWKKYVAPATADLIDRIKGEDRVRSLYKQFLNPIPAVDIIIKYDDGIVLIKRQDGNYALPGGFVGFGESTETAAVREAKEETNLDVKLEKLLGVYSDPKRDPRTHIMSITYVANGSGELKSGDDAKDAFVVPIEDALKMKLAFDHGKILQDYKGYLDLRENIAALEHEQWSHWIEHMLTNSTKESIQRWRKQISTPYANLTEKEKNSDREWADKVLKLMEVLKQ